MIGTMLEYLSGVVHFEEYQVTKQPVEVDVEAEAGGDVVRDPTHKLPVHLTIFWDPPEQTNNPNPKIKSQPTSLGFGCQRNGSQ